MIKISTVHGENCDALYCQSGETLVKVRFHSQYPDGFYDSVANAVEITVGAANDNICVCGIGNKLLLSPDDTMTLLSEAVDLVLRAERVAIEASETQALKALNEF